MPKIDLHGMRHEEVARTLENFLYEHMQKGTTEIEVVTGNSTEMKGIVKEVLSDYDMTCEEKFGNFGTLIVNMK